LLSFGYKIDIPRKMMCRPTDIFPLILNEKYYYRIPDIQKDLDEMIHVYNEGYKGGIDDEVLGKTTYGDIKRNLVQFFETYSKTNSLNQSLGIVSSRPMENACRTNIVAKALVEDCEPDHDTIATFISTNNEVVNLFQVFLYPLG
jgi:hypothetical protein